MRAVRAKSFFVSFQISSFQFFFFWHETQLWGESPNGFWAVRSSRDVYVALTARPRHGTRWHCNGVPKIKPHPIGVHISPIGDVGFRVFVFFLLALPHIACRGERRLLVLRFYRFAGPRVHFFFFSSKVSIRTLQYLFFKGKLAFDHRSRPRQALDRYEHFEVLDREIGTLVTAKTTTTRGWWGQLAVRRLLCHQNTFF